MQGSVLLTCTVQCVLVWQILLSHPACPHFILDHLDERILREEREGEKIYLSSSTVALMKCCLSKSKITGVKKGIGAVISQFLSVSISVPRCPFPVWVCVTNCCSPSGPAISKPEPIRQTVTGMQMQHQFIENLSFQLFFFHFV